MEKNFLSEPAVGLTAFNAAISVSTTLTTTDVLNQAELLNKITGIPPAWSENILIVDDQQNITELIRVLLNYEGNIDVAHNGQDALELIEEKFYNLIISDINMPIMDGPTLFKEAVAKFPELNSRFLFITGDLSLERKAFFDERCIKYLEKPMKMNVLKEAATRIIFS